MKKDSGVTIITLIITIIVILILSTLVLDSSTEMIDESVGVSQDVESYVEDEEIRTLITYVATGVEKKAGIPLEDGTLEVIVENGNKANSYGNGYYLLPGGDEETMELIKSKNPDAKKYNNLTACYIVKYDTQEVIRINDLKFK